MKKFFFIALAAAAMFAVSCEKENLNGSTVGGFHNVNEDGTAYVNMAINLPTTPTKANDVFDDGEGYEYTVENGTLVVFAGTGAEDALTLRSAYNLNHGQWNLEGTTDDQITTTRTITQQILTANIVDGETLYALVILNKHSFFNVAASGSAADITTLYQGTTELTNKTFADFKKILLDEADKDFSNQSFTMTNMPYAAQVGGANATTAVAPKTLVEINSDAIYGTREEAETSAPAAEINVERLVAKVTVNIAPSVTSLQGKPEVTLSTLGWFIDNTNPTTYVVRNVADPVGELAADKTEYTYLTYNVGGKYRMISANFVRVGLNQARTFWGIDANYNTTATGLVSEAGKVVDNRLMDFDASHVNQGGRLRPAGSHYYCPENTFDVKHQTVENTTRVVFAVEFNGGDDFYTMSTEQGTIRDVDAMKQYVSDDILARVNVQNWLKKYIDYAGTPSDESLRAILDVTVAPVLSAGKSTGKGSAAIALSNTGLDTLVTSAAQRVNAVTEWNTTLQADQTDYIEKNINNQLNFYADGVAYYQALIRHFDDTETPWTGETSMKNETESIYNSNDENAYLGRYGVVRNNWYDITVTGIRQIGSSVVPPLTSEPDDTVEQFISIRINIMPWAKRTQSVIL